ncbi:MAG: WD40 repeat domain-containing protein [Pseudomonadota bacterium]
MPTVAPYDFDAHVEWAGFLADEPVFATVEGIVHFPTGQAEVFETHEGLLSAVSTLTGDALVSGGEDGRVVATSRSGSQEIATHAGKWIDALAAGPNGALAYVSGRTVWLKTADTIREISHERAVEGLCFGPKGMRLACARYNGATLHWAAAGAKPIDLQWDGAHTDVTFSPDGKYVVTTMAENALHGWRLDDRLSGEGKHMRMAGYPSKPKSLSWGPKGRWLASSGAPSAVVWPFIGKDGPMGKAPKELGTRSDALVTQVAFHPVSDVLAAGFNDGMVIAVQVEDGAGSLLRRPGKGGVTSLNWDKAGDRLAFGTEEGEGGVIDVTS